MLFQTDSNATVPTLPTPPNSPYTNRDNIDKLICETPFEYLPLKSSTPPAGLFFFMKYWWEKSKIFTWASASVNEPSESGSSSEWDSRSATETLRRKKKKKRRVIAGSLQNAGNPPSVLESPDTYKPSASSSSSRNTWAILALSFSMRIISFFSESRINVTLS